MSVDSYFCFCCLSTDRLCSLFGTSAETNYAELLKDFYGVELNKREYEDGSYICEACAGVLRKSMEFKAKVLDTVGILQSNGLIETNKSPTGVVIVQKALYDTCEEEKKLVIDEDRDCDAIQHESKPTAPLKTPPKKTTPKLVNLHPDICLKNEKKFTVTRKKGARAPPPLRAPEPSYKVPEDLKCRLCGEQQLNIRLFHFHMNKHFPNHICETCGKGYITQKRLRRHMTSHDTGSYKCDSCKEVFTNYNTFNSHKQRKHSSVPVYACPSCPRRFDTMTRRQRHLAAEHGARTDKYECPVCGLKFVVSGSLSSHMRHTHYKVERHKCSVCDAGFFHKQELRAHQSTHDGLKGFKCNECTKSYPRKNALVVHMRTHAPERPFKCDKCRQSFTQKCSLIKHGKLHNPVALEIKIEDEKEEVEPKDTVSKAEVG